MIQVPLRLVHCDSWGRGLLSLSVAGGRIYGTKNKKKEVGSFSVPIGSGGITVNAKGMDLSVSGGDLVNAIMQFLNDHPEQVMNMRNKFGGGKK